MGFFSCDRAHQTQNTVICRETPDDRFLHIGGGLQLTYDGARQPYRFNRTSGELLQAGNRVTGVTYGCGELPQGTVRIVLNSQLAEGVQDYFGLREGETLLSFGPLLSEAVSAYLGAAAPQGGEVRAPHLVNPVLLLACGGACILFLYLSQERPGSEASVLQWMWRCVNACMHVFERRQGGLQSAESMRGGQIAVYGRGMLAVGSV